MANAEMRLTTRLHLLLVPVLGLAVLAGCKKASDDDGGDGPGPSPTGGHYTALGASDAVGIGASIPCLPFTDCPGGTGYVPRILRVASRAGRLHRGSPTWACLAP